MTRIFINYRRQDTFNSTSRIYEWLSERYGEDQVFMDVDAIEPGLDWREAIEKAVGSADLVLAVIGNEWLAVLKGRLSQDDPMRRELETALSRNVRIIPILVEGAKMPGEGELPESLAPLTGRQAFTCMRPGDERFRVDKDELYKRVDRALRRGDPVDPVDPGKRIVVEFDGHDQEPPPSPQRIRVDVDEPGVLPPLTPTPAPEAELAKWNWGAFLLTWIWGIGNGVYRSLLVLVPVYGIYEWIMLGHKGNRMAWEARPWDSFESFHRTQRKWATWAIVIWGLVILIIIISSAS